MGIDTKTYYAAGFALVLLAGIGLSSYTYSVPRETPVFTPASGDTVEYRNEKYGFSLRYPQGDTVAEFDEGGGAITIVFENKERARGLQIFIVPYAEDKITDERFYADVPSGIRENVEATALDGVEAVTFTSFDPALGETREIWFIRNGHLFEITTFKGVGTWFTPIIQSWRFL